MSTVDKKLWVKSVVWNLVLISVLGLLLYVIFAMGTDLVSGDRQLSWREVLITLLSQIFPSVLATACTSLVALYYYHRHLNKAEETASNNAQAITEARIENLLRAEFNAVKNSYSIEIESMKREIRSQSALQSEVLSQVCSSLSDNLVSLIRLGPDSEAFSDFEGELHAFNAPMSWEASFFEDGLRVHRERYLNPLFSSANYYYPILSQIGRDDEYSNWAKRIYNFFRSLSSDNEIRSELVKKLKIWVPLDPSNGSRRLKVSQMKHHHMTFFYGKKGGNSLVVYFQPNQIFLDRDIPKFGFQVYRRDFCDGVWLVCEEERKNLHPIGIDEFLSWLKIRLDKP